MHDSWHSRLSILMLSGRSFRTPKIGLKGSRGSCAGGHPTEATSGVEGVVDSSLKTPESFFMSWRTLSDMMMWNNEEVGAQTIVSTATSKQYMVMTGPTVLIPKRGKRK